MSSWATQQKIKYILGFIGILILVSLYPTYSVLDSILNKEPTCFDQKRNQDETGVDCGGVCELACIADLKEIQILWTRIFQLSDNTYDLATYIENPNKFSGIKDIGYTFTVYDVEGNIIYTREGFEYINPRELFVIFEPNVTIDDGIPAKVIFEFDTNPRWIQMKQFVLPIVVKEKILVNEKLRPRINATVQNNDLIIGYRDLDIVALVSDVKENVIAASATYIDTIEKDEGKQIFLTWPTPFQGEVVERACMPGEVGTGGFIYPTDIILVFDRSGSMNDDGGSPPQPLTNAKEAAKSFVDTMSSDDQVGLVSFATEASDPIDKKLTSNLESVKSQISRISIKNPDYTQHTNLGDAIKSSVSELITSQSPEDIKKAMIILTDGITTRPLDPTNPENEAFAEEYAKQQAQTAHESNISTYVIGLGNGVNDDFLSTQIASSPAFYYKATSSEALKGIYSDIATAVCREEIFNVDFFIRSR